MRPTSYRGRLFQNLILKIKDQALGWGQSSRSYSGSNIWCTHISFILCYPYLRFLRYGYFKIWPWQSKVKITGEVIVQGHIVVQQSLPFHVTHPWDTSISKFDIENPMSRVKDMEKIPKQILRNVMSLAWIRNIPIKFCSDCMRVFFNIFVGQGNFLPLWWQRDLDPRSSKWPHIYQSCENWRLQWASWNVGRFHHGGDGAKLKGNKSPRYPGWHCNWDPFITSIFLVLASRKIRQHDVHIFYGLHGIFVLHISLIINCYWYYTLKTSVKNLTRVYSRALIFALIL